MDAGGTTLSTLDNTSPALAAESIKVTLPTTGAAVVENVGLTVQPGEVLALVGESGSGKTTIGMALMGLPRAGSQIDAGTVEIDGVDFLSLSSEGQRDLRGHRITFVPQDPSAALNPALRIRSQLREVLSVHESELALPDADRRIAVTLEEIGLPSDSSFLGRFPHQLSGGQQQRVVLAMAFLPRPLVIILDEPTTGLDVSTQAKVLATVRRLCAAHQVAAIYISHDLAVVAELADRVMVLYAGRQAELATTAEIFSKPGHPYTARLLAASPDITRARRLATLPGFPPAPGYRPAGCAFAPRCELRVPVCSAEPPVVQVAPGHTVLCHRAGEIDLAEELGEVRMAAAKSSAPPALAVDDVSAGHGTVRVLHSVSLDVHKGECLALVGGSGSGKTTLAHVIVGLLEPVQGSVAVDSTVMRPLARERSLEHRRRLQYIFQNPYASLNPRQTVDQIIEAPLKLFSDGRREERRSIVSASLERVALPASTGERYPDELSGGERQRVAIARALVCEPKVLVCDEITSSLDVSVQAAIIDVLQELQAASGFSMLFITHNLALVRSISQRVIVMDSGRIVESGPTAKLLSWYATHPYTQELCASTPSVTQAFSRHSDAGMSE